MNYEYLWKALEALAIELKGTGLDVQETIQDLKSAKTLFTVQHADPDSPTAVEAQLYLDKAEANLLSLAEPCRGKKYVDNWLKVIEEARQKGMGETSKPLRSFVPGVPKGQDWVRIKTSELVTEKDEKATAVRLELECKPQEQESILVYGKSDNIKKFIREIAEKARPKKQK